MASRNGRSVIAASACALLLACTSNEPEGAAGTAAAGTGLPTAGMNAAGIGGAAAMGATGGTGVPIAGMNAAAGAGAMAGTTGGMAMMGTAGTGMMTGGTDMTMAGTTGGMDAAGMGGAGGMDMTPLGPEDGDPMQPIVSIPDVACGGPTGGFGLGSANFNFDGRDMIVTYPCNKHAGAPATFILNLHGTTPVAQHFYQHGYFSAHTFSASHNLIIVTPSSVVQQWGNGDGGVDEPHLMKIIDWVYETLNGPTAFDIRGMWVGGHSWGAMYTATFGCKAELADKVKGIIIMSGRPTAPACTDRVALIDTNAEMDIAAPLDQATFPMSHGCDASMMLTLGNNTETLWPNCDPGFVHANYLMLGKEHADFMDMEVVESIVDLIKLSRQ